MAKSIGARSRVGFGTQPRKKAQTRCDGLFIFLNPSWCSEQQRSQNVEAVLDVITGLEGGDACVVPSLCCPQQGVLRYKQLFFEVSLLAISV